MKFKIETGRILNLTDQDEYDGLNGKQTKIYNLIISAGIVDLTEGGNVQVLLWDMFPEGTATGDAFRNVTNGLVSPPIEEE